MRRVLFLGLLVGAFFCGLRYKPGDWKLYLTGAAIGLSITLIGQVRR